MSRPRSHRLLAAIADVASGMTVYAAAKLHGLAQSSIHRAIKPPAEKPRCPTCGHAIKK
jgi:transposase